jgi:choline dehydrogenase-like flavoprotein
MSETYDVIIVGSGAGGSAAAYRLAQAGRRVLVLERGPVLPADGSTLSVATVLRDGAFKHRESWLDGNARALEPGEFANLGGKTKWYGAALLRFAPQEFEPDPAHRCTGWPIGYRELEPYYEEAERLLGVRNFPVEPDLERMIAAIRARDPQWREQPMPLGLHADILEDLNEARHFDGFALPSGRKSDAQVSLLDRPGKPPNLEILTNANVVGLRPAADAPLRVSGVVLADGREFRAREVVLAGGALHSPRLLEDYLAGTGLGGTLPCRDAIGRNYKCHLNSALVAVFATAKTDVLRKTVLLLNERFPHSSAQNLGWLDGEIVSLESPAFVPRFVNDIIGRRSYGFWLTTEDGSHPDNRVLGKAKGTQLPQLDYDVARLPEADAEHRQLVRSVGSQLLRQGAFSIVKRMPLEATAHACGTLATGDDPRTSVIDAHGKVHGLANLHVADGSALPRSSRVNPALTIYAWGLRVGHRLCAQP